MPMGWGTLWLRPWKSVPAVGTRPYEVIGGCNGNLKGICQLVTGMKAEDVIARLDGTLCGFRNTSCPDQIAQNLKKALEEMN